MKDEKLHRFNLLHLSQHTNSEMQPNTYIVNYSMSILIWYYFLHYIIWQVQFSYKLM